MPTQEQRATRRCRRMISAIIVSHNGLEHLRHCLTTLQEQRQEIAQVIVVDNGSNDGSPELVRQAFSWVELIQLKENLGFGQANNRGAEAATGEYLLLLNSDAWLRPGAALVLAAALDADPRLGLAAPHLLYPNGTPQLTWAPETGVWGELLQKLRNPFEGRPCTHRFLPKLLRRLTGPGWYTGACLLVRRCAFQAIDGFDPEIFLYFEDVDLCRRLRLAGWRLGQVPGATAYHVKGGSQQPERQELEYRKSQLYYYAKHRPVWENRLLGRRLRRKFSRLPDGDMRRGLLTLLDEHPAPGD